MAWAWYASLPFGGVVKFTGHTGDSYNSTGMAEFQDAIKAIHPGIFVHSVYIDKDLDNDRKAGFVRIDSVFVLANYLIFEGTVWKCE